MPHTPDHKNPFLQGRDADLKRVIAGEIAEHWPEVAELIKRADSGGAVSLVSKADAKGMMQIEVGIAFWVKEAGRAGKP